MYVVVKTTGSVIFRYDYRLNNRRETVTLGRYGKDGISLTHARELCIDARHAVADGVSPTLEKSRGKRKMKEAKSFGEFGERYVAYRRTTWALLPFIL